MLGSSTASALEPPPGLPRYDLAIQLDTAKRLAIVRETITFTNTTKKPVTELVFNVHGRYTPPDDQIGFLAKMAEVLRMSPKESMSFEGAALDVKETLIHDPGNVLRPASFRYCADNACAMKVPLAQPVGPGQQITIDLVFDFKIPAKKGRWSQWNEITALAQWLPTLAVVDDAGWHALPFIPWHQPFYNEAGLYTAHIVVPCDQKLACPTPVTSETRRPDGWTEYDFEPAILRDFSLTASARYQCVEGTTATNVKVRCLHLPEHADYAKLFVETAVNAIPVYERWFGEYPYRQFTIAEACFGWNGNECGGLVLIDDRMFNMPSIAKNYPIYLLQHELCHQWWYNVVGTNGYAETFMDEAMATYFSHRLADQTIGKNNTIITYPTGLGFLPNIHRDDLRFYGIVGARARGDVYPTVQPIDKYEHLPNLLAHAYDRGGKVIGQIEQRMGETAFLDFMHKLYRKYAFRILRVADFQKELELYTGRSWEEFFRHWVWGDGVCDWKVERVTLDGESGPLARWRKAKQQVNVTVDLIEQGGFPEPTVLGVKFGNDQEYTLRLPIDPSTGVIDLPEHNAKIECESVGFVNLPDSVRLTQANTHVRITFTAPCAPTQITVDPDHVILDACPDNNNWVPECRWRFSPIYTQLDELDVTNSYDRWNIIFGPWLWMSTTVDPWYERSPLAGFRVGAYRTQDVYAGAFVGYRTNDRALVAGADVIWDHVPSARMQLGLNVEQALTTLDSDSPGSRAAIWARYILTYGSSLLMPPFEYVELFGEAQHHPLPDPYVPTPGAERFNDRAGIGVHYHKNMLTPYWDAEGGLALDATYQFGLPCGDNQEFHLVYGQVSTVKSFPSWMTCGIDHPVTDWLKETRFAFRLGGAIGLPDQGQFFTLGGGDAFRGYDVRQRQGNATWVASVEWRVPLVQNAQWDYCDKIIGVRNVYLAPFYDAGNAYVNNHSLGDTAHALGVGLRIDVQWLGIIERSMIRFDVAKTVNDNTPWQFWFGISHPF
jgi:hypothetical protein